MANEATQNCLMTHEELLKELEENPQEGDSFRHMGVLRVFRKVDRPYDGETITETLSYTTRGSSNVSEIKLVPRAPKQPAFSDDENHQCHPLPESIDPGYYPDLKGLTGFSDTPTVPKPEGRRYTTTIIDDPMPVETPCQIAQRITTADRRNVYGHPADDFKRIADMWSAYLGVSITAEQVGMCQILVKVGRLAHTPGHFDSLVDVAGYSNCVGMILQRRKDGPK